MNPETIVQNQLDAYNNRDINAFLECHSKDYEAFSFSETTPYLKGRKQLEETYSGIFKDSPNLYSKLLKRIVLGNTIIDHEEITGRKGVDLLELVAIYEVENGLIVKGNFIR